MIATAPAPCPPPLLFDAIKHRYELDGRELTPVTSAIKNVGTIDDAWFTPESRFRGNAVHTFHHRHESGLDWWSAMPAVAAPYAAGWMKFKAENNHTTLQTEIRLCHPTDGWAGTLDSLSMLNELLLIMDLKTSQTKSLWWWLQLRAYLELVRVNCHWLPFNGADLAMAQMRVLQLCPDGTYRLLAPPKELNEKRALDLFYSALKLSNFMKGK